MTLTSSAWAPVAHNAIPPPSAPSAGRSVDDPRELHPTRTSKANHLGYAPIDGAGFIGQTNVREVRLHLLTTYLLTKPFAAGLWLTS
jgi:hypothetical protein